MNSDNRSQTLRSTIATALFPDGIPTLWCPPLTHFAQDGSIDAARIRAHLRYIRPSVPTLLVPGSTSEGWELSPEQESRLVDIAFECATEMDFSILIGVLRTGVDDAARAVQASILRIFGSGQPAPADFRARRICGFAVTAPKGGSLSQRMIYESLEAVLALGYPTALYQLPQITENEIAPETVAKLASRFPNLYLLKDTSGGDRVVNSKLDFGGVFFVRGAEGNYAKWYKPVGGAYDGFLLSSANCFPSQLRSVLDLLEAGRVDEAEELSARVSRVVLSTLEVARSLSFGNQFTNAAKAIDHFMAFGPDADLDASIRLVSGSTIPRLLLESAREALSRERLMPRAGYLHNGALK